MRKSEANGPATRAELWRVRDELRDELRSEIRGSRDALGAELRGEIRGSRDALGAELRGEIKSLRVELKSDIGRVAASLIRTQADVAEIRSAMATKDDISRVLGAIDGLAGNVHDLNRTVVVWDSILGDHRRRIEALEADRRRPA